MRTLTIVVALMLAAPAIAQDQRKPAFDPDKIGKLLDAREGKKSPATTNAVPLDPDEVNGLRARLMAHWVPPVGAGEKALQVSVRIRLSRAGILSEAPIVLTPGDTETFKQLRDSAVRAVFQGQPYTMLKAEHYETWKDIEFVFDAKDFQKR
jgi:colicin import membrane protein